MSIPDREASTLMGRTWDDLDSWKEASKAHKCTIPGCNAFVMKQEPCENCQKRFVDDQLNI